MSASRFQSSPTDSPRPASTSTGAVATMVPKNESAWPGEDVVDCGCANGLSPGRTVGYGCRADTALEIPRPTSSRQIQTRSEEHTSELQSRPHLVCRLLLEKKKHNK